MKKGNYLVTSSFAFCVLSLIDAFLRVCRFLHLIKRSDSLGALKKILLCNTAHLGDVVLSTAILPLIQKYYPGVEIGFLAGSGAKGILEGHSLIHQVHYIDHWKLNRSSSSLWKKCIFYFYQRIKVIKEIRRCGYDGAIDLYPYFPNSIPLLYQAGIPLRAGYISGGFKDLLTIPVHWENKKQSIVEYHKQLLVHAGILNDDILGASSSLPCLLYESPFSLRQDLPSQYVVFHMGSGSEKKQWDELKWRGVLLEFIAKGQVVIFTGQGVREMDSIDRVTQGISGIINLCNQLNMKEFISVIQRAQLLISVDSVAGHVASAYEVPSVILFSGISDWVHWKPQHAQCVCLLHSVPCSPCFKKTGCPSMRCIQGISIKEVIASSSDVFSCI